MFLFFIGIIILAVWLGTHLRKKHTQWITEEFEITHMEVTGKRYCNQWFISFRNKNRAFTEQVSEDVYAKYKEGDIIIIQLEKLPGGKIIYHILGRKQ